MLIEQTPAKTPQFSLASSSEDVVRISHCRSCGKGNLRSILSLGEQYVSNFVGATNPKGIKAPLDLILCEVGPGGCGLLQLQHNVTVNAMYFNYWYKSGLNPMMCEALADIAVKASAIASLSPGDLVLDIGCNDGTLLRSYPVKDIETVGFDPARNLMQEARIGTSRIINDFFGVEAFVKAYGSRKAKIITSIAMFYDLQDPNRFVADIASCLHPNGVWVIQMSYLPLMLSENAFDNICHEHLEYYSLFSLEKLLDRHHLKVVDLELNDVNGGSFRVYVSHENARSLRLPSGAAWNVKKQRAFESLLKLNDRLIYDEFAQRIEKIKEQVVGFIQSEVRRGKKAWVYGASTKGNTLLQYFGLDHRWIEAAAERNPDKWGMKTVGTWIPIVPEEEARKRKPDYFLILPWHFLENFLRREAPYLASGGKFIVPLPEFRIIAR